MAGAGFNKSGTRGVEGDGLGFAGNEGRYMMCNFEEGSSSSNVPVGVGSMQRNAQLGIDEAEENSKTPTLSLPSFAIATPSGSRRSVNTKRPRFYIEQASDLLIIVQLNTEPRRSKLCEFAYSAMDELSKIAVAGKPLWQPLKGQKYEAMDEIEYLKLYGQTEETLKEIVKMAEVGEPQYLPNFDSLRVGYAPAPRETPRECVKIEGSRDIKYVKMNAVDIVQLLMNTNEWSRAFYDIVASSTFLGVFLNGVHGSNDGRLQVMNVEFQMPTPFAATWECYFARYCKKLSPTMWGVVDFSLEKFIPYASTRNFRRRPSGCLIKEMPDGYSKVEHLVADYGKYNSQLQPLIASGLAFGASRWLASLVRTIEYSETLKTSPIPTHYGYVMPQTAKTGLLNVAGRMMRIFCADISASSTNRWTQVASLATSDDLRIMVKNTIECFGRPQGSAVIFSASVSLPAPPRRLFDFLRDANSRTKWDILSRIWPVRELAYAIQGNDPRNRVSIIQAHAGLERLGMFYVQESYTDSTGSSYVVYSPVEKLALSHVLNGGNPDFVNVMPSGFVIFPDGKSSSSDHHDAGAGGASGSILTIAYYIILGITGNPLFIPSQTVAVFKKLIADTVAGIEEAVIHNNNV